MLDEKVAVYLKEDEKNVQNQDYELATAKDKKEILELYRSQLGREFCPWTEQYPTEREIDFDLAHDALLIKRDENGAIIATISLDKDEEVESLDCWSKDLAPGKEVARLAVKVECQNRGLAQEMLKCAIHEIQKRGYKSIHFLVNKYNEKALRSYSHLHFSKVGEIFLFEQPFYCYEKEI